MSESQLIAKFAPIKGELDPSVLELLQSLERTYSIDAEELFFKWESYVMKMGVDETVLDLNTARMFAKDMQHTTERAAQTGGLSSRSAQKSNGIAATPRSVNGNAVGDVYGMLDNLTPAAGSIKKNVPVKRKNEFNTPAPRRMASGAALNGNVPFSERQNAGAVLDVLNDRIPLSEPPIAPWSEPRIKIIVNSEIKKFAYKPMSMKLSESSEVLDDRIEDYQAMIQKKYGLEDLAFGNASAQGTNEIVAVGRICSDNLTGDGKLNAASLLLETSRRTGAGIRVPLRVDKLPSYAFFPGQVVALRGTNASGLYFQASEILQPELPGMPISTTSDIDTHNRRLGIEDTDDDSATTSNPLNIIVASGPYTSDNNLDFEPLSTLCALASDSNIDALLLTGPFLDIDHPLLSTGDFDPPPDFPSNSDPDIPSLFAHWISRPLAALASSNPSITILLIPSTRDMISKHVSWPQEKFLKSGLGLPRSCYILPDPCFVSLNEIIFGITSHDVLWQISREMVRNGDKDDVLDRVPKFLIEQRHFFPLFPSVGRTAGATNGVRMTGDCIDVGYSKLGEWTSGVRPDVLVLPGTLTPSSRVVESVVVVNPGMMSKKKAPGTYARMTLKPRILSEAERVQGKKVTHDVFDRARVEVVRI